MKIRFIVSVSFLATILWLCSPPPTDQDKKVFRSIFLNLAAKWMLNIYSSWRSQIWFHLVVHDIGRIHTKANGMKWNILTCVSKSKNGHIKKKLTNVLMKFFSLCKMTEYFQLYQIQQESVSLLRGLFWRSPGCPKLSILLIHRFPLH